MGQKNCHRHDEFAERRPLKAKLFTGVRAFLIACAYQWAAIKQA